MVTVAIGSTNPVKINAVKAVFRKAFRKPEFVTLEVDSSVPEQPIGDNQIMKGAIHRARKVQKKTDSDFGVGIEGGVIKTKFGLMSSAWCAIVNKNGKVSLGGGMHFHIPKKVAKRIRNGEELGPIMDDFTGRKNVKKQGGTIEILTQGLVTRTGAYQQLIKMALSKFLASEWYRV